MSDRLQSFGHDQSTYSRPNQAWSCGREAEGRPCASGPDARGRCRAAPDCRPRRRGDRWHCTRSSLLGGPCQDGPLPDGSCARPTPPCQPVRSLRKKRGILTFYATAAAFGLLTLAASGDWYAALLSPGELSFQHGQILVDENAESCGTCHGSAHGAPLTWLQAAFAPEPPMTQSQLCLQCHATSPAFGAHAQQPHGLAPAVASARPGFAGLARLEVPRDASGELACGTCHREHRGRRHDLTALTNAQCQSCHQQAFHSLSDGHPAFGSWPYQRRTRIAFDHAAHRSRHFPDRDAAFSCGQCHAPDESGRSMRLAGFGDACASCHEDNIASSAEVGVAFLRLPGVDVEMLADAGFEVGPWPEDATIDIEGGIAPFARLLLSADPDLATALATLGDDAELNYLDDTNDEELEAAAIVARGVRTLVSELAREGQAGLRRRLEAGLGRSLDPVELASLTAHLDVGTLRAAERAWFPESAAPDVPAGGESASAEPVAEVGWRRDDMEFTLSYLPSGHADPFLRAWLELGGRSRDAGALGDLVASLVDGKATGLCGKCHSADAGPGGALVVNWRQDGRGGDERGFTRFTHRPHLIQPGLSDCGACHAIDAEADVMKGFAGFDPMEFERGFGSVGKETCGSCHTSEGAGDSCLTCHNYHVVVREMGPAVASSKAPAERR